MSAGLSGTRLPGTFGDSKPIIALCSELLAAPPKRHAGEWANDNRILPAGSPEPGPWRSSRVPYFNAIYAAFEDPQVTEVHVIMGSQMSKTEGILNILGKRFDEGPRVPALYVAPTRDLVTSVSQERVSPMLASTRTLAAKWERGHRDKVAEKYIGGLRLGFAWAGSKTQLASRPCGVAILDELDRMNIDVEGEGSPVMLVRARLKNYARAKLGTFSTPTIQGFSPGQGQFESGSREFWEWECTACANWFVPWLSCLKFPKEGTPAERAAQGGLECPHCGHRFRDQDKTGLNAGGRYTRYKVDQDGDYHPDPEPPTLTSVRSFWVVGNCSPWTTFTQMIMDLCRAYDSKEPETIQGFVNTFGGQLWRTHGEAPDWKEVQALELPGSPQGKVPDWAHWMTAGVDVQKDCLYFAIRAWGHGITSHLVHHGQIMGEPEFDAVWLALWRVLERDYHPSIGIQRTFVDSGYKPGESYRTPDHQVYRFARRHMGQVFATKGWATQSKPIIASKIDLTLDGLTIRNGLHLWNLDAPYWKSWVYSRLRWPRDSELGRWTVHEQITEDYCRQVVAEEQIRTAGGRIIMRTPRHKDDHYGDCEALATAAAFSLHVDSLPEKPQPTEERPRAVPPPAPRTPPPGLERRGLA